MLPAGIQSNRARTHFTGVALDRASAERKDAEWVAAQAQDPRAGWWPERAGTAVLAHRRRWSPRLARLPLEGERPELLLGLEDGAPLFARRWTATASPAARVLRFAGLRDAGALLPGPEAGLAAYLRRLTPGTAATASAPTAGAPTDVDEAGFTRRCPRWARTTSRVSTRW